MVFHRNLFLVRYYSCCTLPTLSSWSQLKSYTVFLCIPMLITVKYTASVRRHQSTSYRCACRPVLSTLPTECHQIDCSLTPTRQSSCGAQQLGDRVNCLLHYSKCAAIMWHHPQSFKTLASIWTLMSACVPKSHELSHTASVFWGSYVAFVVRCLTRSFSLSLLRCCWRSSTSVMPHWSVSRRSS